MTDPATIEIDVDACVLEVGNVSLSVAAEYRYEGRCLRVTVRADGPSACVAETEEIRGDDVVSWQRSELAIVDIAKRVLELAGIDRGKLAPGDTAAIVARNGRPRRGAECLIHALAWAALGVAQIEGGA